MAVRQLLVRPCQSPLRGSVPAPADPQVGLAALGVAACAQGTSHLRMAHIPQPVKALAGALRHCGVVIDEDETGLHVHGEGLFGLKAPEQVLDARGAPLAASVLAGLLASRPFESVLVVDDEWCRDVLEPLQHAHAVRSAPHPEGGMALTFASQSERVPGIQVRLLGTHWGAKLTLLLAGLRAGSSTTVQEEVVSPDHCERLLHHLRIPVDGSGVAVTVHPPRDADAIAGFDMPVVGDLSAAAYLAAAALIVPESHVTVRGVGLNPSRTALLEGLRAVGAQAGISPQGDALSEPVGELVAFGQGVRGGGIGGEVGARLGDDFVALALLGAVSRQPLELSDLVPGGGAWQSAGLRDVTRLVGVLRAFGVDATPTESGLVMTNSPAGPLRATRITTGGDHRLALAATVLGLRADGPTWVDDVDCVARFFPRWVGTLQALGASVEVVQ